MRGLSPSSRLPQGISAVGTSSHIVQESWLSVMPKQKTHKGTKKRFRVTASGKVKHRQSGTSHLAARMSHKRKRNLRGTACVDDVEATKIREALCGYSR